MAMAAVVGGLAVASAVASAKQAQEQNRAVRRSQDAAQHAAAVQGHQLDQQAEIEGLKRKNESQMIRARLRVANAEAGTGDGFESLYDQVGFDEALNNQILETNRVNEHRAIESGLQVNLASLASQGRNAILAAFQGGLQGAQTGLQISSLAQSVNRIDPAITPDSGDPLLRIGGSQRSDPDIPASASYIGGAGA